jgi:hypothetical protein
VDTDEYHACGGAGGAEFGNIVSSSASGSDCGFFRIRRGTNELGIEAGIVAGMVAPANGGSTCTEACGAGISYKFYRNAYDGKVGAAMLVIIMALTCFWGLQARELWKPASLND